MMGRNTIKRGFTLVELMVAVALLGLVMTVIFSLFSTTSDSLREADSLANTLDRARFAVEQVSADLRSAGAFASPDSQNDPRVRPRRIGANSQVRVAGVASYTGWQNDDTLFSSDIRTAHEPSDPDNGDEPGTEADTQSNDDTAISFDGFIVFGAIDFPTTFEIADLSFNGTGEASGARIPPTPGSLFKLLANDPFYTGVGMPGALTLASNDDDSDDDGAEAVITRDLQNRLVRVMDRSGMIQLGGVNSADYLGDAADGGVEFDLHSNWVVQNSEGQGQTEHGLERNTEGDEDIRYNAALVDAYWYHVEQDPEDPVNYRLVRERLNAYALAQQLQTSPSGVTKAALESNLAAVDEDGNTDRDRVVITDRVVDFQVWFDCADANGNVTGLPWQMKWANPAGVSNDSDDDCMDPSDPMYGRARMGHVRLSVRTMHERKDAPDDADALFMNEDGEVDSLVPLRYFNMYPEADGAARVVTVQSDVELTNFGMRNIVNTL